jgi:signal peptidase I
MSAVFVFFIGMALIFLLGLFALPFVMFFSVKIFKGQIKMPKAILTISILFVTSLFSSAVIFLAKIDNSFIADAIHLICFFVGILVVWRLIVNSFADKKVRRTIGALIVYSIVSSLVLPMFMAVLSFGLRTVSTQPFYVKGSSMSPSLSEGDYVFVDVMNKDKGSFERGDIVAYRNPKDGRQTFIHRVIGLPGEKVSLSDGKVFINYEEVSEPYLSLNAKTYGLADGPVELSNDEYFVLGDDRGISKDSRSNGALKKDLIIGEVVFRGYPFDRLGVIGEK